MVRDDRPGYWRATRRLMAFTLAMAAFVGVVVHIVASWFEISALGRFPLAYVLAALAGPVILVAIAFWFAGRQDAIDRAYGMAGED